MTRYERGFMRKCAEYGVDGRALLWRLRGMAKTAQAEEKPANDGDQSAGIGTYYDNGSNGIITRVKPRDTSYVGRLMNFAPLNADYHPEIWPYAVSPHSFVSQGRLDHLRHTSAADRASTLFPHGSRPWQAIVDNLVRAGAANQAEYLETGNIEPRNELDTTGIENIKLSPEQQRSLLQFQNSQVRNGARGTGRVATV